MICFSCLLTTFEKTVHWWHESFIVFETRREFSIGVLFGRWSKKPSQQVGEVEGAFNNVQCTSKVVEEDRPFVNFPIVFAFGTCLSLSVCSLQETEENYHTNLELMSSNVSRFDG